MFNGGGRSQALALAFGADGADGEDFDPHRCFRLALSGGFGSGGVHAGEVNGRSRFADAAIAFGSEDVTAACYWLALATSASDPFFRYPFGIACR